RRNQAATAGWKSASASALACGAVMPTYIGAAASKSIGLRCIAHTFRTPRWRSAGRGHGTGDAQRGGMRI
ncbi:MAG TPA: hypothetical protein VGC69_12310, partial [Bordetella sp.]